MHLLTVLFVSRDTRCHCENLIAYIASFGDASTALGIACWLEDQNLWLCQHRCLQGCSRNYPQGWVGCRHFFVLWGEGVSLTMCPRSGGVNLSWGSRRIWSIVGRGGSWSTCMSWGLGGSDSMRVLGVEGSQKKCGPPPPEDNFWNSPQQ